MTFPKESLIVVALDHSVHAVHCMNFERRALRQSGQRVRVLVYVEGTVSALTAPVDAKGLSDGENMRLVERAPWNDDSRCPHMAKATDRLESPLSGVRA